MKRILAAAIIMTVYLFLQNLAVQMIISLLRSPEPFLMMTIAIMTNVHVAIAHAWTFMPVRSVTSMKQV